VGHVTSGNWSLRARHIAATVGGSASKSGAGCVSADSPELRRNDKTGAGGWKGRITSIASSKSASGCLRFPAPQLDHPLHTGASDVAALPARPDGPGDHDG